MTGADDNIPPQHSTSYAWPLEAQRHSLDDPLLECLVILAGDHGRRTSIAAITAGLPIPREGIVTPSVFQRAAERVNLKTRMIRRQLDGLVQSPNLPCILVLKDNHACILKSSHAQEAVLIFPETPGTPVTVPVEELKEQFSGYAFFVSAVGTLDDRAGPQELEEGRDWFWSAIWENKKIYYEVILAAVMINLFALASPLFVMNVYDRVIPNNAVTTLWTLALGVMVAYTFDFIIKNLRSHFLDAAGRRTDIKISSRIFEHMLGMKMAARPPSAGVLASNMREFETLRDFFTSASLVAIVDFPFILLFWFLIFLVGGSLVFVPMILGPLVVLVGLALQKPLDKIIKESVKEGAFKSSVLIETITGLETLKVQAAEGHTQRKWEELVELSSTTGVRARGISALGINTAAFAANLSSVIIVVYGAYLIAAGDLSMGALIACVILSGRAMAPLAQVAALLTKMSQSREALLRLDQMMHAPVERPKGQTFVSKSQIEGRITFKDVAFSYPNQPTKALQGIDLDIRPGEKLGIIGAVGSGKTTLERLILNLYQPTNGSVQVDGTDVRQIDPADLRRNIGVVQQNPYFFFGSVRENITLGHETVPDSAVVRAAELAGVMEFLRDSEAGLDTQVGERAEFLSGGQRQAIAIARALLYDPPILLLDEPTASIDPGSEKRLYHHLKNICAHKTVILITHKSAVLGLVDQLVLMDRGRMIARGPRDDVIKDLQAGKYRQGGAES